MQPAVRIRQAAEALGVSDSSLRKWERSGRIPKARRTVAGQRVYTPDDLVTIRRVIVPEREGQHGQAD